MAPVSINAYMDVSEPGRAWVPSAVPGLDRVMEDRRTVSRMSIVPPGRETLRSGREISMALPPQPILRNELLALLGARVAMSQDEACVHLAQRLGKDAAGTIDSADPLFRGEVRSAAHALVQDGLVELRPGPSCMQWRIVRLRDAAESPDEIPASSAPYYSETASITVKANKYEKDRNARKRCVEHYGARCAVCEFDFEKTYGALGRGCVRVHHIVPVALLHPAYELDPVRDLRPVCSNCHYMLHRTDPAYSIDQLRGLLQRQAQA